MTKAKSNFKLHYWTLGRCAAALLHSVVCAKPLYASCIKVHEMICFTWILQWCRPDVCIFIMHYFSMLAVFLVQKPHVEDLCHALLFISGLPFLSLKPRCIYWCWRRAWRLSPRQWVGRWLPWRANVCQKRSGALAADEEVWHVWWWVTWCLRRP